MTPSTPLRILHVASHSRITSGGSVQFLRAAAGQARRGHSVSCVVHRRASDPLRGHPTLARLADASLPYRTMGMRGLRRWLSVPRMRRILRDRSLQVVHVHRERALAFVLASLPAGPRRFALVAHRGNTNPLSPRHRELLTDARIDAVVAVAGAVRDCLVEGGVVPDRVRVIYGSVDTERFRPDVDGHAFRREMGVPDGAPLIGILANLDAKKDHGTFLAAGARIREARPDARFVLVGKNDPGTLREQAEALGLGDAVRFAGFREDVPSCLAAFDVSVSSSHRSEGLTGAVRESFAMARPVVCTRVGGNVEIVEDGRTGRLVDPGDPVALADAVLWVLDHPDEAAEMANRGRETVLREMHTDVRQARLEALYREILERVRSDTGRRTIQGTRP